MPERGKSRFATVSSTYIRRRGRDGKLGGILQKTVNAPAGTGAGSFRLPIREEPRFDMVGRRLAPKQVEMAIVIEVARAGRQPAGSQPKD
jgi:hypothetical protein